MIRVNRTPCAVPALTVPGSARSKWPNVIPALAEKAEAINYYTVTLPAEKAQATAANAAAIAAGKKPTAQVKVDFDFKVYGNEEVVKALRALFHNKCAYCDSRYLHVAPTDVEHYRPKKAVVIDGKRAFPGYYWLGADWDNLLPACPRCNRQDQQEVEGSTDTISGGKGNHFPLLEETKRVRNHNVPLSQEEPYRLLLNPCLDDPESVLAYDDDGFVIPRPGLRLLNRSRAEKSIEIYGLFQKWIVEERKKVLDAFKLELKTIERLVKSVARLYDRGPAEEIAEEEATLDGHMDVLEKMFRADAPYLGMLRYHLKLELEVGGRADRLVRLNVDLSKLMR